MGNWSVLHAPDPGVYTITPSGGNATIDFVNGFKQHLVLGASAVTFLVPVYTGRVIKDGTVLMLLVSWHSDRKMERPKHAALGQMLTIAGLLSLPMSYGSPALTVACLAALASGHYVFWCVFWTIPPTYLSRAAAPGGIALILSLGSTGGFFASNFLGWIKTSTGTLTLGFYAIAALVALGTLTLLLVSPKLEGQRAAH